MHAASNVHAAWRPQYQTRDNLVWTSRAKTELDTNTKFLLQLRRTVEVAFSGGGGALRRFVFETNAVTGTRHITDSVRIIAFADRHVGPGGERVVHKAQGGGGLNQRSCSSNNASLTWDLHHILRQQHECTQLSDHFSSLWCTQG